MKLKRALLGQVLNGSNERAAESGVSPDSSGGTRCYVHRPKSTLRRSCKIAHAEKIYAIKKPTRSRITVLVFMRLCVRQEFWKESPDC